MQNENAGNTRLDEWQGEGRDEALTILLEYSIHSQQTAYIWPGCCPVLGAHFDMCAIFQVAVDN